MKTIIAALFVISVNTSFAQSTQHEILCVYSINPDNSESVVTRKRTATINDLLADTDLRVCTNSDKAQLNVEIASFQLSIFNPRTKTIFQFPETIGHQLTEEQIASIRKLVKGDEILIENIKVNMDGVIGEKYYYIRISVL